MNTHASAYCPVGHGYVASIQPRTKDDDERESNEAQLSRVIEFNGFRVRVEKVRPIAKNVTLSGLDSERAMRLLTKLGWSKL